jgi:anti-sigma factor RsiW
VLFRRSTHATDAELSAYLDGQLGARIRERVAGHLDKCSICQRALEGLRNVQASLRGLPRVRATRSFALREADVRPALPLRGPSRSIPVLSGLTIMAVLAFFAVLGWDIAGGMSSSSSSSDSSKSAALQFGGPATTTSGQSFGADKELAMTATYAAFQPAAPSARGSLDSNTTPPALVTTATFAAETGNRDRVAGAPIVPTPPLKTEAAAESSGSDTGMRIAEAALASAALVLAGGTVVVWRRRSS